MESVKTITIYEKIIPWGALWQKNVYRDGKLIFKKGSKYKADRFLSGQSGKVQGITVHNTSGDADAKTYTLATYPNQNMLSARVHFFVDHHEIWQNLREDEVGWHAGDGRGRGNETTLSVEILTQGKKVPDGKKAEENAISLIAHLMIKHNLSINQIYSHKDWSGKNCPENILPRWSYFLRAIEREKERQIKKTSIEIYQNS